MKNEIKYLKVVIMSLVLTLFSVSANAQQKKHNYITTNEQLAEELSEKYGIPSGVILAVAFVETGGGTSKGAKTYNNHFGIVGKNKVTKSKYKSFDSARESYEAFCQILSRKKYYSDLKGIKDTAQWVKAIAAAGYSTQPVEWKKRVKMIIEKFNLS